MNAVRLGLATLLFAAAACAAEHPWPGDGWPAAKPADVGMDEALLRKARDYALTGSGSGISANVDAMARIGYLYLRRGRWRDRRILPEAFVDACRTVPEQVRGLPVVGPETYGKASDHYGLLWWNNADGSLRDVPRDAYWSWGLYDSLIVVIPSLDIACARAGKSWKRKAGADHYAVLQPFLGPIASSVRAGLGSVRSSPPASHVSAAAPRPPYPPSPVIKKIAWAPASRIIRLAKGSDNWPVTWADDDRLYTAYGDGRGFKPLTEKKLSLGLATVTGRPPDIKGENLRSEGAEPWGPWTTACFTERWDVGPGETASFPTKWMSDGGRTLYLVFSGDDCFSVRKATLTLAP